MPTSSLPSRDKNLDIPSPAGGSNSDVAGFKEEHGDIVDHVYDSSHDFTPSGSGLIFTPIPMWVISFSPGFHS
jgi:hypothetical protein